MSRGVPPSFSQARISFCRFPEKWFKTAISVSGEKNDSLSLGDMKPSKQDYNHVVFAGHRKRMYFKVTHSAIYNWKGSGTEIEQNNPNLLDSFCHLIIAQEAVTEATWVLLIDQGDDTGISTTNCIEYIIPRICEKFTLEISNIRAFEVWPHHKDDPRLKYTEIVISDVWFETKGDWVLRNSWRPADKQDIKILEQLVETVGDKVIRE